MMTRTKEDVLVLVKEAKDGNQDAFRELEEVAKPLLISLSNKFASYHTKFEFDDFYSIGLYALHKACQSFGEGNPSFLSYAKVIILRSFWREVEHWNQAKRNIFQNSEVSFETEELLCSDSLDEMVFVSEFRDKLNLIIDDCFEEKRSRILKSYIFNNTKVVDISSDMDLNYKHVHKIVERGMKKVKDEYIRRYNP